MVARALCRFRQIDFGGLAPADRMPFLRTQLMAWSPFDDSAYAIVMASDAAIVFAWDQRDFEQRARAAGLAPRPGRVWPETLLLAPRPDGPALQRCSLGVEGQVWRDGQLRASRWWPQAPDAAAWRNFQRSGGVPAHAQSELPPAATADGGPDWLPQPWAQPQTLDDMAERSRLRLHAMAALAAAALLLPTLWLAQAHWSVSRERVELDTRGAALATGAQPLLTARTESLTALATLDALVSIVERPQALDLLTHLSRHLPADGSRITRLEWDGSRLRLALAVPPGTARITYVDALEGGGWLRDVREDSQDAAPGAVVLAAEVPTARPPAAGSPDATAPAAVAR